MILEQAPFHRLPGDGPAPARAFWVQSEDGLRLRLAHWPAERSQGTVFLFTGRTEYLEKYAVVGDHLANNGFDVLSIDWRGQGMSDRLQSDPRPGHIVDFADYQTDVVEMLVAAQRLELPRPWHLLAHSMGGAIALAALDGGLPMSRVAFTAPMWGIRHEPFPARLAFGLTGTAARLGRGGNPAIRTGGRGTWVLDAPFRGNLLTSDALAWGRLVAEADAWPDLTIGGASWSWVNAALRECVRLSARPSPEQPMLTILGDQDRIVSSAAIRQRVSDWDGARLLELSGCLHEPLFELPDLRARTMNAILAHFTA